MQEYLLDILALDEDENLTVQEMWDLMQEPCLERAKTLLGVSKTGNYFKKETWWWNEETRKAVNKKDDAFKAWSNCPSSNTVEKEKLSKVYEECKKVSKQTCAQAQAAMYEKMYQELEEITRSNADRDQTVDEIGQKSKIASTTIYKIAAQRRRNAREIVSPKFICDAEGNLLVEDQAILNRWREYCEKLLNETFPRTYFPSANPVQVDVDDIHEDEVFVAIKTSKKRKATGPDEIPVEFWMVMEEVGVKWLTVLFEKLLRGDRMPDIWRESFLIPLYKGKGDARNCDNFRSTKLMSHTMKVYERVINTRIRRDIKLSDNQCGFVSGKSTTDAIQAMRIVMEKHRDASTDLHMIFVDFEKAFDRQARDLIWVALREQSVPETYIQTIQDMYEGVTTRVK